MAPQELAEIIDQALPQTQCTKCGFDGCRPYAVAIALDHAPINRCPPGGTATIARLAALTSRQVLALDPECGNEKPLQVAVIDERLCIGCTLCIAACPVDAIFGAAKQMHHVVSQDCSGCDLCVEPCPVDCITMLPADTAWTLSRQRQARIRHDGLVKRRTRIDEITAAKRSSRLVEHAGAALPSSASDLRKRTVIDAALARARARRAVAPGPDLPSEQSDEHNPSA